jgi:hypothetical protein
MAQKKQEARRVAPRDSGLADPYGSLARASARVRGSVAHPATFGRGTGDPAGVIVSRALPA